MGSRPSLCRRSRACMHILASGRLRYRLQHGRRIVCRRTICLHTVERTSGTIEQYLLTPSPFSLRLFGPFRAQVGGEPIPRVRTRSVEWLLAILVLRHGAPINRSWLAGTLWPESEETRALQNL